MNNKRKKTLSKKRAVKKKKSLDRDGIISSSARNKDETSSSYSHFCKITSKVISVDEALKSVQDESCGAIVLFIGTVRNYNDGRLVNKIHYESYVAMAEKRIQKIQSSIKRKWPQVRKMSIVHRIGDLAVGDISVIVCTSAPHRAEAFEASRYAIDTLKQSVPIWKMETYADDFANWINGVPISVDNDNQKKKVGRGHT